MADERDLARIVFEVKATIPLAVHDVAKAMIQRIGVLTVASTPVDTGAARSNWIATSGSPSSAVIPPYAPGNRLGRGEGGNREGAINQIRSAVKSSPPGKDLWLTNNIDYIEDLNAGKSKQTEGGFVERAVEEGVDSTDIPKILARRLSKVLKVRR